MMPEGRGSISEAQLAGLRESLLPLIGVHLQVLRLPRSILQAFEPSQIGMIVGGLMDACIPELPKLLKDQDIDLSLVGLSKHEGILGEREGYPDYSHVSGMRLELKLLYRDPTEEVQMKSPPTPREPSARLTQKVTIKNVDPNKDVLMVVAYELRSLPEDSYLFGPRIVDIGLFPMIDCIHARDDRLMRRGGKWFGGFGSSCRARRVCAAGAGRRELEPVCRRCRRPRRWLGSGNPKAFDGHYSEKLLRARDDDGRDARQARVDFGTNALNNCTGLMPSQTNKVSKNGGRHPKLLDLFCCAGGAAMGYHRAGFDVVGVDLGPQPHFPFDFHQGDALSLGREFLASFDAIHASPPCQAYSDLAARNGNGDDWPKLIEPVRELLEGTGLPYVIENVDGAPLINYVVLCGTMFEGLRVLRHRLFETNFHIMTPPHGKHPKVHTHDKRKSHYGKTCEWRDYVQVTGGGNCSVAAARDAMGISWMNKRELNEAIPPAYTEFIGKTLIQYA